jgi:hypothetical protein
MAKKPVVVPPTQQEDELTVTVFRFRGSSESMQKGFEAFGAALGAALGTAAPPARQVNGNRRKAQAQLTATSPVTTDPETVDTSDQGEELEAAPEVASPAVPKSKKAPGTPKYSFLPDFDLAPAGKTSLKDFVAGKAAEGEQDKYLLVCWWLQTEGGADPFTGNHIFTCFRALNWKPRLDVNAPVREMKSKKSFFDSPVYGKWRLTQPGLDAAGAVQ